MTDESTAVANEETIAELARRILSLPATPRRTPADRHREACESLSRSGFCPDSSRRTAVIAYSRPNQAVRDPEFIEQLIAGAIQQFCREFFTSPPETRTSRWRELMNQSRSFPQLWWRLKSLEPGLSLSSPDIPQESDHDRVASTMYGHFLMSPESAARSLRRLTQELATSVGEPRQARQLISELHRRHPSLADLKPAEVVLPLKDRLERLHTSPIRPAPKPRVTPQATSENPGRGVAVFVVLALILIRVAASLTGTSLTFTNQQQTEQSTNDVLKQIREREYFSSVPAGPLDASSHMVRLCIIVERPADSSSSGDRIPATIDLKLECLSAYMSFFKSAEQKRVPPVFMNNLPQLQSVETSLADRFFGQFVSDTSAGIEDRSAAQETSRDSTSKSPTSVFVFQDGRATLINLADSPSDISRTKPTSDRKSWAVIRDETAGLRRGHFIELPDNRLLPVEHGPAWVDFLKASPSMSAEQRLAAEASFHGQSGFAPDDMRLTNPRPTTTSQNAAPAEMP